MGEVGEVGEVKDVCVNFIYEHYNRALKIVSGTAICLMQQLVCKVGPFVIDSILLYPFKYITMYTITHVLFKAM